MNRYRFIPAAVTAGFLALASLASAQRTIVVDAGHGGHDRGGVPYQRIGEKGMTLDVAQRLRGVLQRDGYRVVMTRTSDVFIPLGVQMSAGVPWASAAGQARAARASLTAWRSSADRLICSWARLEGDAHRSPSPLLARVPDTAPAAMTRRIALTDAVRRPGLESIEDVGGIAVDKTLPVRGGVKPLTLQAE